MTDLGPTKSLLKSHATPEAYISPHSPRKLARALEEAAEDEAGGGFNRPILWMPSLMSAEDGSYRPSQEEEARWRSLFSPPPDEYLIRCCGCALSEARGSISGELFVGSQSLCFRSSQRKAGKSLSVSYKAVNEISKKVGGISGGKGFVVRYTGSEREEQAPTSNLSSHLLPSMLFFPSLSLNPCPQSRSLSISYSRLHTPSTPFSAPILSSPPFLFHLPFPSSFSPLSHHLSSPPPPLLPSTPSHLPTFTLPSSRSDHIEQLQLGQ